MKFKRIGRVLVCLLLVSALLINASPIKAKASAVGATAAITAASTVLSPAGLVVGATFIALGLAAAANPEGFQNMVDAGVSALESAGTWVKDGMVELLRTEDADGNASYYVDSGMMEDVRSWTLDSGTVVNTGVDVGSLDSTTQSNLSVCAAKPYFFFATRIDTKTGAVRGTCCGYADREIYVSSSTSSSGILSYSVYAGNSLYVTWDDGKFHNNSMSEGGLRDVRLFRQGDSLTSYSTSADISLGVFSSVPVDGTSARQWSEEYTDRGLYVVQGGSDPDPDHDPENNGTWFWSIMLPLTALELYTMSQADEWSGQTPQEFDDYTNKTEYEILSQPEIEFGHGIEIRPVTSPTPDSGGGTDPTQPGEGDNPGESTQPTTPGGLPDIGGGDNPDPGTTPDVNTDYSSWFSKLYTVVQNIQGKLEEIPNRFQSWITDCKTAIEELPSKFAEWFNNIASQLERAIEGITTLGQQFAQGLQTLGQNIVSGIQTAISTLFQPSPNYFSDKVAALKAKHHNIDKFTQLGNDFKLFFTGLGSKAPVIWIDLGAATGSYIWGGEHIFMDLTWYSQYKPKMDFILGAIIWLWLGWRVFLSVPGIINGASGVWGKYHRGGSRDDN